MIKNIAVENFEKWLGNVLCQAQQRFPMATILFHKIGSRKAIIFGPYGGTNRMQIFNDLISKVGSNTDSSNKNK